MSTVSGAIGSFPPALPYTTLCNATLLGLVAFSIRIFTVFMVRATIIWTKTASGDPVHGDQGISMDLALLWAVYFEKSTKITTISY